MNNKEITDLSEVLKIPPYSLTETEKNKFFRFFMHELTNHHKENCIEYKRILDVLNLYLFQNIH